MSYIHELFEWTKSPRRVIRLLVIVGILQASLTCSCGATAFPIECSKKKYPDQFCFNCNQCGKNSSIRTKSPFYKVRKSLPDLVTLIWACAVLDEQPSKIHSLVKVSTKNAGKWMRVFRICMATFYNSNVNHSLGGEHTIVEIDESNFAKKNKYHRGASSSPKWVFGAVDRRTGLVKMKFVANRQHHTLIPLIRQWIPTGTRVISDSYSTYFILSRWYNHQMVNHSHAFVDEDDPNIHTETIEGLWHHAKIYVNKSGGTREEQVQEKLDAWMFRRTFLKNKRLAFYNLCRAIAMHGTQARNVVSF